MSYRNTAGEDKAGRAGGEGEGRVLLKTYLYYSLWIGDERGPWFRGLVTLTERSLTLTVNDHTVSFPNEAILEVEPIETPPEVKGVSSIVVTYPSSSGEHPNVKLCFMGPSTIISALMGILKGLYSPHRELDDVDLKLLMLLKAGIRDLRVASMILGEDLQSLYIRMAKLLKAGLVSRDAIPGETIARKT